MPRAILDVTEHFWSNVDRSGGIGVCHPWTGSIESSGYGQLNWKALGGKRRVHVVAFELTNGEIPFDPELGRKLDIDHKCHNQDLSCPGGACHHRRCCNGLHLIAKTTILNKDSADHPRKRGAFKEVCNHGHELDEINTGWKIRTTARTGKTKVRPPERYCKRCERTKQCMFPDCQDIYHDHAGTPWPAGNGASRLLERFDSRR